MDLGLLGEYEISGIQAYEHTRRDYGLITDRTPRG